MKKTIIILALLFTTGISSTFAANQSYKGGEKPNLGTADRGGEKPNLGTADRGGEKPNLGTADRF